GASGNSPARKGWVDVNNNEKPRRGDTIARLCRPFGAGFIPDCVPRPFGLGYYPTPLRGEDKKTGTIRHLLLLAQFELEVAFERRAVLVRRVLPATLDLLAGQRGRIRNLDDRRRVLHVLRSDRFPLDLVTLLLVLRVYRLHRASNDIGEFQVRR